MSGKREVILVSEESEEEVSRKGVEEVAATLGLYDASELSAYVGELGRRVARHSPRSDVDYAFQIVDMQEPNAFALPRGPIYVSRGLLALVNSEDELAGVLGHEIAHVASRHAAQRQTRALPLGVLALPGAILEGVIGGPGALVNAPLEILGGGLIAAYSRDQEREADEVGQQLAARAGADPEALASFLVTLERYEALEEERSRTLGFFQAHPNTPERVADARRRARGLEHAASESRAARDEFLRRLEGLILGSNPRPGVFREAHFLQPDLDLSLEFPDGWETQNTPSAVIAVSPERDARLLLEIQGEGHDPRLAANRFVERLRQEGRLETLEHEALEIGGKPAFRARALAGAGVFLDLSWIAHSGRVFRIVGGTAVRKRADHEEAFAATARSFRSLTAAERASIRVTRLTLVQARSGESLGELVDRRGGAWSAEETALANGLPVEASLEAGQLLKLAVEEAYFGG